MTAFKGHGTYGNAAGVETPLDFKLNNASQVVKATATTIRAGVFWPGTATIVSGTAGMAYSVIAYGCVTQRSAAAGAVFGGNDGTLSVSTTAAPGSNSRYDVVYHWHREYSLDGTDSNPVIGVVQGTAAASPTVPSLAAFPGAIELARILVPAGVTATNTGTTITQTAPFTALSGGIVPVRTTTERDAGTWITDQQIWQIDTGIAQIYTGSAWRVLSEDTGWTAMTLLNSWVNFGGAYSTARYRRRNGMVEITGLVKSGTIAAGTIIATLPAGFRPATNTQRMFTAVSNNTFAVIEIQPSGNLIIDVCGSNAFLSLEGTFSAEQ